MNVKSLILAFICLNIAVAIVESFEIFNVSIPYESLTNLQSQFSVPSNWENIVVPSTLAVGGLVSVLLGYGLVGISILMIGALSLFWRPAQIVVGGFGLFLERCGVPPLLCQVANVFSAVIWMFFIIEYLGGRQISEN